MKNQRSLPRFLWVAVLALAFHTQAQAQFVDFSLWEDAGIPSSSGSPGGITVEDYDGDGLTDILVLNGAIASNYANTLYRNTGNGFQSVGGSVLPAHTGKFNAGAFADFNGDGAKDLYLGTWNYNSTAYLQNHLFINAGDGTFTIAAAGPPVTEQHSTAGCSWADIDGDGWVDIFIANLSTTFSEASNALYHHEGDGTFSKIEENIAVTGTPEFSFSGNWADVDGDKDLDLYVANAWAPDQLYYNDGAGNFSLYESEEAFFNTNTDLTYNGSWGDYDNDGDLDLFVASGGKNYLYNNDGAGHFLRVAGDWEYDMVTPVGAWGDYDNDGDLDLFVTSFHDNQNRLFRNDDGQLSREEDAAIPLLDGFAGVADFDNDGFLDVVIANGGFSNTTNHTAAFLNEGNDNHWAQFNLLAKAPNTSAIGAVVRVKAQVRGQETWQMRQVASSSHESSSSRLHFGLGDATVIDEIVIEWPDGGVESYEWLSADQIWLIEQGVTGVSQRNQLRAKLTLSPNPAGGSTQLQLETEETVGRCTISLFHLTGQLAWSAQQNLNGTRLMKNINLRGLPAGMYTVQVETNGKQIVKTLVITP